MLKYCVGLSNVSAMLLLKVDSENSVTGRQNTANG